MCGQEESGGLVQRLSPSVAGRKGVAVRAGAGLECLPAECPGV